ncbi:MAG: PAS domain S-box protein, partial [Magnetococcales bacterium]|nr:PAS domain S-box protein [Magnetococcales bacterium]
MAHVRGFPLLGMLHRLPLTVKAFLVTVVVGAMTWSLLDLWQTGHLKALFQSRLAALVGEKAMENRVIFDRYIQNHHQVVRLLASQKNLLDYLDHLETGAGGAYTEIIFHHKTPEWLPRPPVLRILTPIRYLLLLDAHGAVREIYQAPPEPPPPSLLKPARLLQQLSHNQTFLTLLDGNPFLLASETILDAENRPRATLMLATPLDEGFLAAALGPIRQPGDIAALLEGTPPRVLASNEPQLAPPGIYLSDLKKRFLVAGQSFFDYGSSDLLLQLVTLISTEEFDSLNQSILLSERQQRAITALTLIVACLVIIIWITRNIEQVTRSIVEFAQISLGFRPQQVGPRDELQILREQFEHFTREIIRTRDDLREELTERERAEGEIRKLSQAVEQSPAAVMITDLNGQIQYVNPQFTRLTGYEINEVIGRNPSILRSGETPAETYREMWEAITTGSTWKGRLLNRRKSGETYWENCTISSIRTPDDRVTHYLAIKEDITLPINVEKAMRRAKEAAEAANQMKSDFLANITHELRTPLNAITGVTHLVLEGEFGPLNPIQGQNLRNVLDAADNLSLLINDLLDLSRVDSKQFILEETSFNLPVLCRKAVEAVSRQAQERGLILSCHTHPETPSWVLGDPVRMRQVLLNVLRNAVKFTHQGRITMTVGIHDDPDDPGAVRIAIADTGIGIPEEKLEAIFDPFIQGDSSSTRMYGGVGMGLAIAKRLINLMGGRIHAESALQQGSTFFIDIPFKTTLAVGEAVEGDALLRSLKVLTAGDNQVNRLILTKLLGSLNLTVEETTDCRGAWEILAQRPPEERHRLFFLDFHRAAADVGEVVRMRERLCLTGLPVILFHQSTVPPPEDAALSGVFYLSRPLQRQKVREVILEALSYADRFYPRSVPHPS